MAYFPAYCDGVCEKCSQNNNSGWCIALDIPIYGKFQGNLSAETYSEVKSEDL